MRALLNFALLSGHSCPRDHCVASGGSRACGGCATAVMATSPDDAPAVGADELPERLREFLERNGVPTDVYAAGARMLRRYLRVEHASCSAPLLRSLFASGARPCCWCPFFCTMPYDTGVQQLPERRSSAVQGMDAASGAGARRACRSHPPRGPVPLTPGRSRVGIGSTAGRARARPVRCAVLQARARLQRDADARRPRRQGRGRGGQRARE